MARSPEEEQGRDGATESPGIIGSMLSSVRVGWGRSSSASRSAHGQIQSRDSELDDSNSQTTTGIERLTVRSPEGRRATGSREREAMQSQIEKFVQERDDAVKQLNDAIEQRDEALHHREHVLHLREYAAYERDHAIDQRDKAIQEREDAVARLCELEQMAEDLHGKLESKNAQVIQFKKLLSTQGSFANDTADDEIKRQADQIFHSLQSFAAQNFKGMKLDFDQLPNPTKEWAREHIPGLDSLPSSMTINIVIATVTRSLVLIFEPQQAFGLRGDDYTRAASLLASLDPHLYSETKPWIDMTRKVIQHKHSAKLKANNESLVYRILEEVYNDLAGPSSMWKWSEKLQSALAEILQSCVDFAQLLHRQSAIYEVHLPKVVGSAGHRRKFDSTFLEDVKNGDEEEVQNRTVEITLFPAVLKFGNERRENLDMSTYVSKAKVLLQDNTSGLSSHPRVTRARSIAPAAGVHGGSHST